MWSYAATVMMIGAGLILLPFILHSMSAEAVGIWQLFQTITMLVTLLDFGFRPTFARNISYIFAGVKELRKEGVAAVEQNTRQDIELDYGLLKATIGAMRRFYRWIALSVLAILLTAGTAYMLFILGKYTGDRTDALIAWVLLITINSYNLYTLYYDALVQGKGYVKRTQQIMIVGQLADHDRGATALFGCCCGDDLRGLGTECHCQRSVTLHVGETIPDEAGILRQADEGTSGTS